MPTNIIVPHLGESIESARLVEWHKAVGDEVKRGDELADIETDKATMPLEAPKNGVLLALLVEEGTEVHIGELLAVIGKPGEEWSPEEEQAPEEQPAPEQAAPEPEKSVAPPPPAKPVRAERTSRRVSPLARRRAEELGVDIEAVQAADGGRIKVEDVERYALDHPTIPSHQEKLSGLKQIVGNRMLQSAQDVPQFSVSVKADASTLLATRGEHGVTALLVYFVVQALLKHPHVNSEFNGDALTVYDTVNLGVAVATQDGLRVPVLHAAETLSAAELGERIRELAAKARENKLTADEVAGGTFTVSNLGMYGVSQFVPIINPPQAAILGVGEPFAFYTEGANGDMRLTRLMDLTLSADHRVLDGAEVAEFLATLKTLVEACQFT
jgi:pyruvate dehydrogenase E2 component (dihydrolipoamide acetyltransferase)